MIRNYFLLNLLLILIIALLGVKIYKVWTMSLDFPNRAPHKKSKKIEINIVKKKPLIEASYEVITTKNLFHPSRSAIKNTTQKHQPAFQKREFQLFGTTIIGNKKFALLEDLSTKKTRLYKVNDKISDFTIKEIFKEKVILQKDNESIELNLRAVKKFKPPKRIRKRQSTVRKPPKQRRRLQRRSPPIRNRRRR